jgi:imidazolonepropionase-like amidohydrolase
MTIRTLHLALLILCFVSAVPAETQSAIAITNARVIDGTGAAARVETVVIRDERIVAVAEHPEIPAEARIIDASGQTLLPGLFDLHTHLNASGTNSVDDFGKNLKAYLACGVTSVNDYSVYGEMLAPLRGMMTAGVLPGPKVNFAIRLGTPEGHGTEFGWGDYFTQMVSTPAEAHAAMERILPYKPDVIKVFTDGWRYGRAGDLTNMNLETLSAIVEDAHKAGIKVFTHTVTLNGAKIAARAGVDVLAHGVGDAPVDDDLIALLKKSGTGYVSTLATYEPSGGRAPSPKLFDVLRPDDRAYVQRVAQRQNTPPSDSPVMRRWRFLEENVRRLSAAGIPIGVGTDAGVAGTYHGWATLHELELLVDSGLSPLEALTAGTGTSAKLVGEDRDRGTVAAGKIADLVLIQGSPDVHIEEIERTSMVFLGGKQLDPKQLEAAIQVPEFTPLPVHPIGKLVDDAERPDGRTNLDTLPVNATDPGTDHSRMLFARTLHGKGHARTVLTRMSQKAKPSADLVLPLTRGGVELTDVSMYRGISFALRGEGTYKVLADSYGIDRGDWFSATFDGTGKWRTVKIPFSAFGSKASGAQFPLRSLRALHFELASEAGTDAWLELDNLKFY